MATFYAATEGRGIMLRGSDPDRIQVYLFFEEALGETCQYQEGLAPG